MAEKVVRQGGQNIVINIIEPDPVVDPRLTHPCVHGHRWAYLTAGGVACGVCGVRAG